MHRPRNAPFLMGVSALFLVLAILPCAAQEDAPLTLDGRLTEAAANGEPKRVMRMLAKGADVNARDIYGLTPLMHASSEGYVRTAKLLLGHGAKVNARADCIEYISDCGPIVGESEPARGVTALMRAAGGGHLELVKLLLKKGANVNAEANFCLDETGKVSRGWNVLIYAVQSGNVAVSSLLIKRGAKVNAMTDRGWTALMQASIRGNLPLVKLLVQHGAEVNAIDEDGETAVKQASRRGHSEVVNYLCEHGGKE
jgi:ankyrin repeat protein